MQPMGHVVGHLRSYPRRVTSGAPEGASGHPDRGERPRLVELFSPKGSVPLDARFLRIRPPIEVEPRGLPGQLPLIPIFNVTRGP